MVLNSICVFILCLIGFAKVFNRVFCVGMNRTNGRTTNQRQNRTEQNRIEPNRIEQNQRQNQHEPRTTNHEPRTTNQRQNQRQNQRTEPNQRQNQKSQKNGKGNFKQQPPPSNIKRLPVGVPQRQTYVLPKQYIHLIKFTIFVAHFKYV